MGFLSLVRKQKLKEREMRLLILGLDNAGKSTVLYTFQQDACRLDRRASSSHSDDPSLQLKSIAPTLGFNIETILYRHFTLQVWDVGGQTALRPFWRNYFEETDGLVWVLDASDRLRIEASKSSLHKVLQAEKLQGASLLIFLNKMDLQGAVSPEQVYQLLELDSIVGSHACHIQPCSALQGTHVLDGFDWLVSQIQHRLYALASPLSPSPSPSPSSFLFSDGPASAICEPMIHGP